MKLYIQCCKVSDPTFWVEAIGAVVNEGDDEWRLMDDIERPSISYDFLSMGEALRFAQENKITVLIPKA
jgi:hypothetical protein